jgi:Zn-dependent protease
MLRRLNGLRCPDLRATSDPGALDDRPSRRRRGEALTQPPGEPDFGPTGPPPVSRRPLDGSPLRRIFAPLAGAGLLLAKFGAILLKLKFLASAGTMLVSVAAYALLYGWKFAVGLVALIAVHELGHVFALRRRGVASGLPLFLPFIGAFVSMKEMPKSVYVEAETALAGPAIGALGALAVAAAADMTGSGLLHALAFTGFLLNLFNLLPVLPLDGGRAAAALNPVVWWICLGVVLVWEVASPHPVLLLILVLGGFETYRRWRHRHDAASTAYFTLTTQQRRTIAASYIGLVVFCGIGTALAYVPRDLPS